MRFDLKYRYMKLLFPLILCILTLSASAQNTVINGKAPGAAGLLIRLYTIDDFISQREIKLAQTMVSDDGSFKFVMKLHPGQVQMVNMRIQENQTAELYLEYAKTYTILLDSFDYRNPNEIMLPYLSNITIGFEFDKLDSLDLNNLIARMNFDFSSYLYKTFGMNPIGRLPKAKTDSFCHAITNRYIRYNNSYLTNYVNYSLASFQLACANRSKQWIFEQYFYNKPILYDNIQYMYFFEEFFGDYIFGVSRRIQPYDIISNVNKKVNLAGVLDSLGKDSTLKNEVLRETALLLNIRNWYQNKNLNRDSLVELLHDFRRATKFDIHRRIAENIEFMLCRYEAGEKAPDFELLSINNDTFKLDNYKGKYLYLMFFTTWCRSCISEFSAMEVLYENYNKDISFLAISMDKEPLKLFYFMQDRQSKLPMAHFGNDYDFSDAYNIRTYPLFILIDPKGNFVTYGALRPSEGIERKFKEILTTAVIPTNNVRVGQ